MSVLTASAAALALCLSLFIGFNAHRVGSLLGAMDAPDPAGGRKLHASITPLVGGTAVVASIVAAILLATALAPDRSTAGLVALSVVGLAVLAIYVIGLADDRAGLSPRLRLALTSVVLMVALVGDPSLVLRQLGSGAMAVQLGLAGGLFTLLCLVALVNAVNMADGKNGIVITMCLIWSAVLLLHVPAAWVAPLAAAVAALGVMLAFNLRGRLFLGDSGSYGLATFFGLLTVLTYNLSGSLGVAAVLAMFWVPVLDTMRLMVARRRRGVSPFDGDRDHLHHHIYNLWGWPRGLVVYAALVAAPNVVIQLHAPAGWAALGLTTTAYGLLLAHAQRRVAARSLADTPAASPFRLRLVSTSPAAKPAVAQRDDRAA